MYIKHTIVCRPELIKVGPETVPPLWTELLTDQNQLTVQPTKHQPFNYCVIKHAWIALKLVMIQYQVYTSIGMLPN